METKRINQDEKKEQGEHIMPIEYFIRYQGKCYDVGTKLKFYPQAQWVGSVVGTIEQFMGSNVLIRGSDGHLYKFSTTTSNFDNMIVEIIEPVYYEEPQIEYKQGLSGGVCPPEGDVFVGWAWYIAIMLVGAIFKDRFAIWVFATAVFFLWKNGFFNGGKK